MPRNNQEDDQRRVHAAWSEFEAQLVRAALIHDGIPAVLRNERLVGGIGMLPVNDAMVEVWVDKNALSRAEALVHAVLYSDADEPVVGRDRVVATPTHCARCGAPWEPGFQSCWQCSAAAT